LCAWHPYDPSGMDRSGEPALRLVIFDLDGVMYRGREPVPGAAALVAALRERGLLIRFATNNSMATRAAYVPRLSEMGVPVEPDEIVTSTSATIDHLQAHLPEVRSVMTVGAPGMLEELRAAGFAATAAGDAVGASYDGGALDESFGAVLAGLDPSFDFRRLAAATTAIRAGARFIATNADLRYPTPHGFLPGAGTIVAALRAASGEEPLVIGKPEPGIFSAILERAGVPPGEAVAIGDNPDADMVAAHRAGMRSILVLTGVADAAMAATLEGERRPEQVARDPFAVALLLGVGLS
jgi:HAD superfamily hydrolase (TIGR01450 family)